jgi:DegV family protein with EDD domain
MEDKLFYCSLNHQMADRFISEFLEKMATSASLPKTSQPPLGSFCETYDALAGNDVQILSIHAPVTLSGTVDSARQAAMITNADVTVVDSEFVDRAMAFQVLTAAKMAEAGASMGEILTAINDVKAHTKLIWAVPTLDNLVAGGRLNKAVGRIGGLLNIKIVINLEKSEIGIVAKGRGMKTINKYFDEAINDMSNYKSITHIGISHAGAYETVDALKTRLASLFPDAEIYANLATPVLDTHSGPDAFGLMFEYED